jgi:hypothetical protein
MRRAALFITAAVIAVVLLAGPALRLPASHAQDEVPASVREAYQAYTNWEQFSAEVRQASNFALSGKKDDDSFWQQNEWEFELSGSYDIAAADGPLAVMTASRYAQATGGMGDESAESVLAFNLDLARVADEVYWRGSFTADPDGGPDVPGEWDIPTDRDIDPLTLNGYLLRERTDPFVGDAEAWLDAVRTVDGPRTFDIDRSTRGKLYVMDIEPVAVRDALEDRLQLMAAGVDEYIEMDVLLDSLLDEATVTWGVILDPDSDQLRGQYVTIDLSARLEVPGYALVSVQWYDEDNVLFDQVGQPVELPDDLPE